MIIDLFFLIASAILQVLSAILSLLNYVIPAQFSSTLIQWFGYSKLFQGIFPVDQLMLAGVSVLTVSGLWYTFKLILMLLHFIPTVNKVPVPKVNK